MTEAARVIERLRARGVDVFLCDGQMAVVPGSGVQFTSDDIDVRMLRRHASQALKELRAGAVRPSGPILPKPMASLPGNIAALVNAGWSPAAWVERLDQLASCCVRTHPDRAKILRERAMKIRRALEGVA